MVDKSGSDNANHPVGSDGSSKDQKSEQTAAAFEGANHPFALPVKPATDKSANSSEKPAPSSEAPKPADAANPAAPEKPFGSTDVNKAADSSTTAAAVNSDLKGAVELVKDSSGKVTEQPLSTEELSSGDHTIQLSNGRQFVMHVPENDGKTLMPVVFVFTGSIENAAVAGTRQKTPEDFITETGMNQAADKNKFIAVYPMPEFHLLGTGSKLPAYAWNSDGAGIDKQDVQKNAYDDLDLVKSISNALPQLANVDSQHKDWGAIGFSQGGIFLNEVAHKVPNLFPTIGLVGTTIEDGQNYSTAEGNAKNTMIVNLRGDGSTLPFSGLANQSPTYIKNEAEYRAASLVKGERWARNLAEGIDPLGAINNFDQSPFAQQELYTKELKSQGAVTTTRIDRATGETDKLIDSALGTMSMPQIDLSTPIDPSNKITETIIKPKDSTNKDTLTIFDLWNAQHAYPGPNRGAQINNSPKNPFDTTQEFVKEFDLYNAAVKGSK